MVVEVTAAAPAPAAASDSVYQAFAKFQVDTKGFQLNGGHLFKPCLHGLRFRDSWMLPGDGYVGEGVLIFDWAT